MSQDTMHRSGSTVMMTRRRRADLIAGSILTFLVVITLFPYVFMLLTSVKDNPQFFHTYWAPVLPFHWENYSAAWTQISPYMLNSVIVAAVSSALILLFGSLAAYMFARYRFLGKEFLYILITLLLTVPSVTTIIPLFVLVRDLQLTNTLFALMIPQVAGGMVLGIFLMRTFFAQIPEELFEAARLDGANGAQIYLRILLPLSGPIIGTVILLTLISSWNDYFWPLLTITDDSLRTVTVGLAFFQGQNITLWGPLFAGYIVASLPLVLVFTFASRYLIGGLQMQAGRR